MGQTLDAWHQQRENATSQLLPRLARWGQAGADAGEVDYIETWATEGDLGRLLHRHINDPVDFARWREAYQLPTANTGHPVATISVDGTGIGTAGEAVRVHEHPSPGDCAAVGIVVARPNGADARLGVGEVERAAVR